MIGVPGSEIGLIVSGAGGGVRPVNAEEYNC